MSDRFFFTCGVSSHPGFYARLSETPKCIKCGLDPIQYRDQEMHFCFLHRSQMTSKYAVSLVFLLTDYRWRGHEHLFPNAKLFAAPDDLDETTDAVQQFYFCADCEVAFQSWRESQ